jgi:hypothetical protein
MEVSPRARARRVSCRTRTPPLPCPRRRRTLWPPARPPPNRSPPRPRPSPAGRGFATRAPRSSSGLERRVRAAGERQFSTLFKGSTASTLTPESVRSRVTSWPTTPCPKTSVVSPRRKGGVMDDVQGCLQVRREEAEERGRSHPGDARGFRPARRTRPVGMVDEDGSPDARDSTSVRRRDASCQRIAVFDGEPVASGEGGEIQWQVFGNLAAVDEHLCARRSRPRPSAHANLAGPGCRDVFGAKLGVAGGREPQRAGRQASARSHCCRSGYSTRLSRIESTP